MQHTETKIVTYTFTRRELLDMMFTGLRVEKSIEIPDEVKQELYTTDDCNTNSNCGGFLIEDDMDEPSTVTGIKIVVTETSNKGNNAQN